MTERRQQLVEKYYKNKITDVEIMIDNVWDPHNVSAILRTCDGLGIEKVNLYYTYNQSPDLKYKGNKSSASASKWILTENIKDLKSFYDSKKQQGFQFIGTSLTNRSQLLTEIKLPTKFIIIFGNESRGISEEIEKICDQLVFIPMVGMVESFNISVAAAITIYEVFRQRGQDLEISNKPMENRRARFRED